MCPIFLTHFLYSLQLIGIDNGTSCLNLLIQAKKQLEAKYMRLREMTGRLRGRDMEMGRVMEDKMRLLVEMLDEIGVEHNLSQVNNI